MIARLLFIVFLGLNIVQAQPTEPGSEAVALGGSYATRTSVFSARHNVAGMAFMETNAVALGARNNYLANNLNDFYLLGSLKLNKSSLGFDALYYGFEAYQHVELGLSYAIQISPDWAVGSRLRYANNYIPDESVTRYLLSADFGILGKLNNWRLGAAVHNLAQSKWQGRIIEAEPVIIRIGTSYFFNSTTALSLEYYTSTVISSDIRLGMNYSPVEVLDLRIGFATLNPSVNFGIGFKLKQIQINVAAAWHQQLGLSPVTDLVYAW